MKLKLLLLTPLLFLVGCTSSVNNSVVEASIKLCENNGGLSHIRSSSADFSDNGNAYCKNGARFMDVLTRLKNESKRKSRDIKDENSN